MSNVDIRLYDHSTDLAHVQRVWHEVGWVESGDDAGVADFFSDGRALVAVVNDAVECAVHTVRGTMRYEDEDLDLCAVTAVTTSRVARRLGLAQRLTGRQLAHTAEQGAAMAALGMFDQGFYDKVGFATGPYDNYFQFDPSTLAVNVPYRAPLRLGQGDYASMHRAMSQRMRGHGACVLSSVAGFKAELTWYDNGFGLGYHGTADAPSDELTHFVYFEPKGERGPYHVRFLAYQSLEQLAELFGLMQSLGDQVYSMWIDEPPELQLQAWLQQPFRNRSISRDSKLAGQHTANAWCQYRILDLPRCVAAARLPSTVAFEVQVEDPVAQVLDRDQAPSTWRGCGGLYRVELGASSHAERIERPGGLPQLQCSINTFTRLLWGIAPASSLTLTDGLQGSAELIAQLDRALRLPPPRTGWDF